MENKLNAQEYKGLLRSARNAAEVTKAHGVYEYSRVNVERKKNWPSFISETEKYLQSLVYFFPDIRDEISEVTEEKKKRNEAVVVVDLGGIAIAEWAQQNIGVTLSDEGLSQEEKKRVIVGDLLGSYTRHALEQRLKSVPSIDVLFFMPKAGATRYTGNRYAYLQTARLLKMCYERLSPGGLMVIDLHEIDPAQSEIQIENVFKGIEVDIETVEGHTFRSGKDGSIIRPRENIFLIHKPK